MKSIIVGAIFGALGSICIMIIGMNNLHQQNVTLNAELIALQQRHAEVVQSTRKNIEVVVADREQYKRIAEFILSQCFSEQVITIKNGQYRCYRTYSM